MDVSPCNSLLDLRFLVLVLSRTLNGSSEGKRRIERPRYPAGPFFVSVAWTLSRVLTRSTALSPAFPSFFFLAKYVEKQNDSSRGN